MAELITTEKKITWKDGVAAVIAAFYFCFVDKTCQKDPDAQALYSLRRAHRYNRWLVNQFRRFLGKTVLELGAGIGNMTEELLECDRIILAERDESHLHALRRRYRFDPHVKIMGGDLETNALKEVLSAEPLDTLLCLNVMEHLQEDTKFLKEVRSSMKAHQNLIIAVPQHQWLYSDFDRLVGHHQRYSAQELEQKIQGAGFEVVYLGDFNRIGTWGWYTRFRLFGRTSMSPWGAWFFHIGVPLWRVIEHLKFLPALSLIVVARPNQDATSGNFQKTPTPDHK
jgi:phospholipid N-methyltransferase